MFPLPTAALERIAAIVCAAYPVIAYPSLGILFPLSHSALPYMPTLCSPAGISIALYAWAGAALTSN